MVKINTKIYYILFLVIAFALQTRAQENLIICNEGLWQSDNGQLSYYEYDSGILTNKWFRTVNGTKLGDTPNDMIQVNDTLIAIAVNWSNIIQYIHPDGKACGATEDVPNNRKMCSDDNYIYITSYAHNYNNQTFTKGSVAKIDIRTKKIVATCEVGWEPEGICIYDGKLYVINSGGYAFSENHDYETTIDIVDAASMTLLRTIDTQCINLYGDISQAGQFLCINSYGDYYEQPSKTIIFDCKTEKCNIFDFPSTYNATDGKLFYTIGSDFSYIDNETNYQIHTINPQTMQVSNGVYNDVVTQKINECTTPYELYISPYTKNVYFTDAKSFASAGYLYGYTKEGKEVFSPLKLYVNPTHILAIPNTTTNINNVGSQTKPSETIYNLQGYRINTPQKGLYIKNGKKFYNY